MLEHKSRNKPIFLTEQLISKLPNRHGTKQVSSMNNCAAVPYRLFYFHLPKILPSREQTLAPTQSRLSTEPTSFANARYQVKRKLDEGGKKKVYI